MSDSFEIESGLPSYSNPNYQLEPPDVNSNLDSVEDYEDLYVELDTICRHNRKSGIESRRKYAQLDPVSMGVKIDTEDTPMLTADIDNNLKDNLRTTSHQGKVYQSVDNDNSDVDTNDNKELGQRSEFLDYYISLESSVWQDKGSSSLSHSLHSCKSAIKCEPVLTSGNEKDMTVGSSKSAHSQSSAVIQDIDADGSNDDLDHDNRYSKDNSMPSICNIPKKHSSKCASSNDSKEDGPLPTGWEKHEDESGPYYWHISSGTIQREPPSLYNGNAKLPTRRVKEIDMISSFSDFSLNSRKMSSPATINSEPHYSTSTCKSENRIKRRSYPEGSCSLTLDKRPIRFAVRSLGWVEIAEEDLTPEKSSKAVNKCIVDLSMGRNDILDVVGRWGDGKDLFMDLDDYSLRLMDTQDLTILNTQPIHAIRVWGVGRDNGRDFAYVARDRITRKYMCHVFRCDIPARIIANTLRDICKKIMLERSLQHNMVKQVGPEPNADMLVLNSEIPSRPTNLPTEQRQFLKDCHSSYTGQSFPTPMEEPKKILKVHYLGTIDVNKATGVEILNDAIEQLSSAIPPSDYKFVNVAVAPSTITISEPGENGKLLEECRVRFLSFLGIGKNIKHCGFIVHTAQDKFVAHVFYCEPSSGALCKTIEAACKLRYQKCLDAHRKVQQSKCSDIQGNKGLATTIRSILGSISRLTKGIET